jgi:hypothetical protein
VLALLVITPLQADISGFVRVAGSGTPGTPIPGALVRFQADPASPVVVSAVDGSFTLPGAPAGLVVIGAAVPYDRGAATNFTTGGALATDGDSGVDIRLPLLPAADNPVYVPSPVVDCGGCHVTQTQDWQASNHSFAGTDAWVLDLFSGTGTPGGAAGYVFRDLHDPGETGFCATCHTPLADAFDPGNVLLDEVTEPSALEGVSCVGCHQIDSVNGNVNALHHLGNATYRFPEPVDNPTSQYVWAPLPDVTFGGMSASYAPFFEDSILCASCHQYTNPDTGAPGQNTYLEWQASPYAVPGPGFRSCQDCHMPAPAEAGTICVLGDSPDRQPTDRRSHQMIGATPETLAAAILLDTEAQVVGDRLRVTTHVTNQGAGHAFPTGVSIRNAFVVIEVTAGGMPLAQVAGPTLPFWVDDEIPGQQPGDFAGRPGKGYAKVLEGRINSTGPVVRPVLFIDAEGVFSDTLIPAGGTDVTEVEFEIPAGLPSGQAAQVSARLLYRRAWRALAVTKGWTQTPQGGPVEIEVAADTLAVPLFGIVEVPALGVPGLLLLALALGAGALHRLRRSGKISGSRSGGPL